MPCGVSVVSASALEIAARRCREARSVSDLGAVVGGPVRQAVGATAAALLLRSDDGSSLALVSHHGLGDADVAEYPRIDAHSDMPAALVASQAQPMLIASNDRYAQRWPALARERAALGLEAEYIVPLRSDGTVLAILIFDYRTSRAFDTLERTGFARVGAVCAESLQRLRERAGASYSASQNRDRAARDTTIWSLQRRVADLESALQRRAAIERAKGILMERHGLSADQAFELLRGTARSRQQPVVDLARAISEAHALLSARPTGSEPPGDERVHMIHQERRGST
jgi:response regulator NasT